MRLWTSLLLVFGMLGCGAKQLVPIADQVPGLPDYPPPAVFAAQSDVHEVRQLVSVQRGEKRQSFTAIVEADEKKATVVGFGAFGIRLFLLSWGVEGIHYEANPTFDPLLDPRTIYSDMQFALMTLEAEQHIFGDSLTISDSGRKERVIRIAGEQSLLVRFPDSSDEFLNFVMVYPGTSLEVSVRSIEQ